jgi:hypothetical protein
VVPGNRESVNIVLRTSFDPLKRRPALTNRHIPFHKFPKKLLTNECSGAKLAYNHMREARARARAREERQLPTNRTRVSFARVLARGAR